MKIADLDTPALLVDLDRLQANLAKVAGYAGDHQLALVPHTKTHKTIEIARMQLAAGARSLTVAKVSEAEVMAAAEPERILIAYPVIGAAKLTRLAKLSKRVPLSVALDSRFAAEGLSSACVAVSASVGVRVEANVGGNRCVLPPGAALLDLARKVDDLPGLEFEGLQFYPGHVWLTAPGGEANFEAVKADIARIRDDFERAGIPLESISGGSTPTLFRSHEIDGLTEIRPGTSVFNDRSQVAAGSATPSDCAATILTTVISTPREDFALIDGGSKTFTSDPIPYATEQTHGELIEAPGARFYQMNEEHGFIDLSESGEKLSIGDRVRVVPNHVCVAVNMHEKMYGIRGDTVEAVWEVAARGKLQ